MNHKKKLFKQIDLLMTTDVHTTNSIHYDIFTHTCVIISKENIYSYNLQIPSRYTSILKLQS